jgi:hypothetical protein
MKRKSECKACLMDIIANMCQEEEFEERLALRQSETEI